jgi:hypothetical protein
MTHLISQQWANNFSSLTMQLQFSLFWLIFSGICLQVLAKAPPRFSPISIDKRPAKNANLLLYISITSGPAHTDLRAAARLTWLLPCHASPLCDYAFFVDKTASSEGYDLLGEPYMCDIYVSFNAILLLYYCLLMLFSYYITVF